MLYRAYVVVAEAAASHVKEKTNLLAMVVSVLTTFATSFTIPYLIGANYANLGAKLGYVYGSINVLIVIGVYFLIPELKGRTLEEITQLFESGEHIRNFGKMKTEKAEAMYEAKATADAATHIEVVNKS